MLKITTIKTIKKNSVLLLMIPMLFASSMLYASERGGHLIVTIGHTKIEDKPFEDQGVAFKLGTGIQFTDYFSMELYYIYYGKATDEIGVEEITLEGRAGVLQVVGILPVTNAIRLMGKAGLSKWDYNSKAESLGNIDRQEFEGDDAIYGTGILFDVDHDSTVRLEYEYSEYDDFKFGVISVGFQHYFQ